MTTAGAGMCGTCWFWRLFGEVEGTSPRKFAGLCRFHPPEHGCWPTTLEYDRCIAWTRECPEGEMEEPVR